MIKAQKSTNKWLRFNTAKELGFAVRNPKHELRIGLVMTYFLGTRTPHAPRTCLHKLNVHIWPHSACLCVRTHISNSFFCFVHLFVFCLLVTLVVWFSFPFFLSCPSYLAKSKQKLCNIFKFLSLCRKKWPKIENGIIETTKAWRGLRKLSVLNYILFYLGLLYPYVWGISF